MCSSTCTAGAGERWRETLRKADTACEAVILLASPDSLDSRECQREMNLAEDLGKEIIVAILRDLSVADARLARYADRQFADGMTSKARKRGKSFANTHYVMAGLDPRIKSEDRPGHPDHIERYVFLLLDGPIKPGHDESSLLAARTFAPVTKARSSFLFYQASYRKTAWRISGRTLTADEIGPSNVIALRRNFHAR
jgi:hypothetical protein